jgi:hypothetical protein
MGAKHIPCGRFANESERHATEYVKVRLESSGPSGQWFLLTNYANSSGSQYLGEGAVQSEDTTCAEPLSRHDESGIRTIHGPVLGLFHASGQPIDCVSIKIIQHKSSSLLHLSQGKLG